MRPLVFVALAAGCLPSDDRPEPGSGMPARLSDLIYELQLPRLARLAGSGPCVFEQRPSRR